MFNRTLLVVTLVCASLPLPTLAEAPARVWTMQLKQEDVSITSNLVRVGDVVQPVSVPDDVWQRLSRVTVGLVPTDGRPLRLMRYRLSHRLSQSPLLTSPIHWIGPESTNVRLNMVNALSAKKSRDQKQEVGGQTVGGQAVGGQAVVAQTMGSQPVTAPQQAFTEIQLTSAASDHSGTGRSLATGQPASIQVSTKSMPLYNRRQIEQSIERAMNSTVESLDYEIDWSRVPVELTMGVAQYDRVAVPSRITAGVARLVLTGVAHGKTRQVPIFLKISERPQGIAPASNLPLGHIIAASDLQWRAIDRNVSIDNLAIDMESLIGKQTKRTLTSGRLIMNSDVGSPILVRRNDMVEITVVGGAIVVRTGGKSLSDGSMGDLIQIETIQDRKRLLARVTGSAQVEVVTRAPQVR